MSGWEPVYRAVRRIPAGRVASYGQVAAQAGMPRAARQVGYALHALAVDSAVPWHRVVNAAGRISERGGATEVARLQRARLEAEGVAFDARGGIDLERFGWRPRAPRSVERPAPRAPDGAKRARRAGSASRPKTTKSPKSRGPRA
ncbi:MAG: methylated-DNA--[protein]-cysteine S-methyltransferase [Deltaproteobacteria bacterium]|nr:methylated-DNA--[protein]-cysteine S-methyltransferase [Deltaproteobacteria bacterium]